MEIVVGRRWWRDIFWWKTGHGQKTRRRPWLRRKLGEVFLFLHFLPSGASRSDPQRSRARRCSGAAERTLDGEDRCESIGVGGKDLFLGMEDMCHHGGSKDE